MLDRRQFLVTCTAVGISPSLSAAPTERGRFTTLKGNILTYRDPFHRLIRFSDDLIMIFNCAYPDHPAAITFISFNAHRWTEIDHRSRNRIGSKHLPELLPDHLEPDLANNLSLLTLAMLYAERDHPAWWADKSLFQRALAMRKPMEWGCSMPDFRSRV